MKKWVIIRRLSQIFFFFLFIYILWSTTYPLKGFLPPDTFFKIDPLIMIIISISERVILPGIIFSFVMLFLTFIFGRFFCGWVCPLGATIDIGGKVRKNIHYRKRFPNRKLRISKFIILGIIALFSLFGVQLAWILDPMVIMARFVSLNLIPTITSISNSIFIYLIQQFNLYGWLYDFYRILKTTLLGVKPYYFDHSLIILLFFIVIVSTPLFVKRYWCRGLCPLGAFYALVAQFSMLRRSVEKCTRCTQCVRSCRMGAIRYDKGDSPSIELGTVPGECILCMDCIYTCPSHVTKFTFPRFNKNNNPKKNHTSSVKKNISRRNFLILLISSVFLPAFRKIKRFRGRGTLTVIRPPAALKEDKFLNRCIRCGNCMKVCITNGLQPDIVESGLTGIWTPKLVPEIGYCEYNCTLCGEVCPTGAIPKLPVEVKRKVKLGIAKIDQSLCWPWAEAKECIVCEEHCPTPDKAILLKEEIIGTQKILKPYVDEILCIGCGICQTKCPVIPVRAIRVDPSKADRT